MKNIWHEKWKEAYNKASFYKSEKNTIEYWNKVASSDSSGLDGTEHIEVIAKYLFENNLLDGNSAILDVGCGQGDYTAYFANRCKHVTAMDYSENMIEQCRIMCEGFANVSYLIEDIKEYDRTNTWDGVFACLNPATYSPEIFEKLLKLANKFVVYFSMDTPIENISEPVYCGANSVRYPERYLEEAGITYKKLPYEYIIKREDGTDISIPFAFLVVSL